MKNTEKIGSPVNGQTRSTIAEGVYFIKDGKPVEDFSKGVEKDCLLVVGKYFRFYLSMKDLGRATFEDAQEKAAALGEGWRCPDSFEGRTIGLASDEIRKKARMLSATHFDKFYWFWTNELIDRWYAAGVRFINGNVSYCGMNGDCYVLALRAAYERTKGIYKEYPSNSTAKVACGQIFPELIESEDERIRKALIKGLNFLTTSERIFTFGDIPIEDIVAYLEKQKEQKPAEWSEEDEKQLNDIISLLPDLTIRHAWLLDIKRRLKSLHPQPHWKPSEGQMEALDNARFCKSYDWSELDLLYNDLESL